MSILLAKRAASGIVVPLWEQNSIDDRYVNPVGNLLRSVITTGETTASHRNVLYAWCGTCYDDVRHMVGKMMAGGHGDRPYNDIIGLNLMLDVPLWQTQRLTSSITGGTPTSGKFDDGFPRATHTADNQVAMGGVWYQIGCGSNYDAAGPGSANMWSYVPGAEYVDQGLLPDCYPGDPNDTWAFSTAVIDEALSCAWFVPTASDSSPIRGLVKVEPLNGFAITTYTANATTGLDACAAIDKDHHILVTCGGRALSPIHSVRAIELDNIGAGWFTPTITGTAPAVLERLKLHWQPDWHKFFGWCQGSGTTLITLTPPSSSPRTNAWTWGTDAAVGGGATPPDMVVPGGADDNHIYSNSQRIRLRDGRYGHWLSTRYAETGSLPEVFIRPMRRIF